MSTFGGELQHDIFIGTRDNHLVRSPKKIILDRHSVFGLL